MDQNLKSQVTIRFYATLKDKLGAREVTVAARTVAEALDGLKQKFGPVFASTLFPAGRMNDRYIILLKGRRLFEKDIAGTLLIDGDVLDIFPPVAGG